MQYSKIMLFVSASAGLTFAPAVWGDILLYFYLIRGENICQYHLKTFSKSFQYGKIIRYLLKIL